MNTNTNTTEPEKPREGWANVYEEIVGYLERHKNDVCRPDTAARYLRTSLFREVLTPDYASIAQEMAVHIRSADAYANSPLSSYSLSQAIVIGSRVLIAKLDAIERGEK